MAGIDLTGTTHHVPIEAEVFTRDHDNLGHVGEVREDCFKVSAAMQPDYWLPTSCVSSVTGDEVFVIFNKDRLDDFKMSEPRAA
ncbi:MAG TPA: hypothetical protein VFC51_05735 [Chloroflexota bacterium]|nr:hypothetical protein [Chloroflexota bacterium]